MKPEQLKLNKTIWLEFEKNGNLQIFSPDNYLKIKEDEIDKLLMLIMENRKSAK